jgi:acyl-CoA thioesterase
MSQNLSAPVSSEDAGANSALATDPGGIAKACARRMWEEDKASQALGMSLIEITPGCAVMSMTVRSYMANGHGMCHGGFMFLLADSAFAFACNSHNQRAVAAGAEIHFVAPAKVGDVLTAQASEQHRAGRSGFYDVRVTDQNGELIALFRGRSATIKGHLVEVSERNSPGADGKSPGDTAIHR